MHQQTPYEAIGGEKTVGKLVEIFYDKVARHPLLAPLFPNDFTEVKEKQYCFLTQFFGGPPLFQEVYGSPMLRARHLPHRVTPEGARAWLRCMEEAMDEIPIEQPMRDFLFQRLTLTAGHMVNTPDEDDGTSKES